MKPRFFIGIDPAQDTFAAALFQGPSKPAPLVTQFTNNIDGCQQLVDWLAQHQATTDNSIVCVEATGICAETLCYFLHEHGWQVAVEGPLRVKRAFKLTTNKTDPVDAQQIAQYAFRFLDELTLWQPKAALIEQIRTLLVAREQFVMQLSANGNLQRSLKRKVVQTPAATEALGAIITQLKEQIKAIEEQIKRLIRSDPTLSDMLTLLLSIPSVGLLLSAHLMVITDGFNRELNPRQLAAYIGICPYEHSSGSSVRRKAKSRGYGPPMLRKLMYLCALNLKRFVPRYQTYYAAKKAEGKNGHLILNNLANKLLRVICAVIREHKPYHENHRSLQPNLLKTA